MFKTFAECMEFLRNYDLTQVTELAVDLNCLMNHDYWLTLESTEDDLKEINVDVGRFIYDMNYLVYGEEVATAYIVYEQDHPVNKDV